MQQYFEIDYRWNDFNEILKLKQKRDVETISFFMKRGPWFPIEFHIYMQIPQAVIFD